MGIFQSRPEEPTEWAGLPSEPWEPRAASEVLPPPVAGLDALSGPEAGTTSVSISVAVELPAQEQ